MVYGEVSDTDIYHNQGDTGRQLHDGLSRLL